MELERFLLDDGDVIEFADTRARQNILTVQENLTNRINILENQDGSVADVADIKNNILELSNDISNITNSLNSLNSLIKTKATEEYVNQVVSTLINHAPETLDTLGELAIALQENDTIVDILNNAIGNKVDKTQLDDYVKFTDYATQTKAGVLKLGSASTGLQYDTSGYLKIMRASETDIVNKTDLYKPLVPAYIDNIIKTGLTTNTKTLTEEEKAKAQSWLGIDTLVGDINTALTSILGV